jgi:hypothetical protein
VSYRDDVLAAEERAAAAEREVAELRARIPDVDALRDDVRSRRAELVGLRGQIDELRRVRLSAPRIWLLLALAFVLSLLAVGFVPHWVCRERAAARITAPLERGAAERPGAPSWSERALQPSERAAARITAPLERGAAERPGAPSWSERALRQ